MTENSRRRDGGSGGKLEQLQRRLPAGWAVGPLTADEGAAGVAPARPEGGMHGPAAFVILHDGDLWTVTWWRAAGGDDRDGRNEEPTGAVVKRAAGTEERCVSWVIEQATPG